MREALPAAWAMGNSASDKPVPVSKPSRSSGKPLVGRQRVPVEEDEPLPFTDVKPGKYYYDAVLWAYEYGVTSGVGGGKFGVGKTCTRAEIVSFLFYCYLT